MYASFMQYIVSLVPSPKLITILLKTCCNKFVNIGIKINRFGLVFTKQYSVDWHYLVAKTKILQTMQSCSSSAWSTFLFITCCDLVLTVQYSVEDDARNSTFSIRFHAPEFCMIACWNFPAISYCSNLYKICVRLYTDWNSPFEASF